MKIVSIIVSLFAVAAFANPAATTTTAPAEHHEAGTTTPAAPVAKKLHKKAGAVEAKPAAEAKKEEAKKEEAKKEEAKH